MLVIEESDMPPFCCVVPVVLPLFAG